MSISHINIKQHHQHRAYVFRAHIMHAMQPYASTNVQSPKFGRVQKPDSKGLFAVAFKTNVRQDRNSTRKVALLRLRHRPSHDISCPPTTEIQVIRIQGTRLRNVQLQRVLCIDCSDKVGGLFKNIQYSRSRKVHLALRRDVGSTDRGSRSRRCGSRGRRGELCWQ